jgi:S-adenosylmethionine:tRNA ribosyltransferase-isomerase
MHISDFDYELPEDLIAQQPLEQRDASRMLVIDRQRKSRSDCQFSSFVEFLQPADVVVVNNTRVIPARLIGTRNETGGRVEIFLVNEVEPRLWNALVRPGNRLRAGSLVSFGLGKLTAEVLDEPGEELRRVRFQCDGSFAASLAEVGMTPLPPYIKRTAGETDQDRERYQTIYSKQPGAIAAPTAGLHFTPRTLEAVRKQARMAEITLHVGYGTFAPVRVEDVSAHSVGAEQFEILPSAAELINEARASGGRVIAVGTTTMRALESSCNEQGAVTPGEKWARITITPGYDFRVVQGLLTNFHLPRSSLLLLVSAFATRELILNAYRHAVSEGYRFYSYGDCMLIL